MALIVLIIAAVVLGTWVLRLLRLEVGGIEGAAYRLLVGLCLCAVVIVGLGSVSLKLAQAGMLLAACGGTAYELFIASRRHPASLAPTRLKAPFTPIEYIALASIAGTLALALVSALAPVTAWDAGVAHLALPAAYTREGRMMAFEGNVYSVYPQLLHSLYTYAYSQSGETAVALLNWTMAVLACIAIYLLGRRVIDTKTLECEAPDAHAPLDRRTARRGGLIAAAILATSPIFMDQAGSVTLDIAFCGVVTAAMAALVAYHDEKRHGWLIVAAFLAGSACGIRHTGYLVCVLLGAGLWSASRSRRWRDFGTFSAIALLGAAPWLLRTYLLTGNPVYPFFLSWFAPSGIAHLDVSTLGTHESIRERGWRGLLMFPWNIIMRPHWYDGWSRSPGGLVFILGIPGFFVGGRRARWLGVYGMAGGACFFFFQQYARYMLPFFFPLMALAALAAVRLHRLRVLIAALLAFTFAYGLALDVALVHFKFPVVLGRQTREDYLRSRIERYPAFEWVNENIPKTKTILTLDLRSYYLEGPSYQNTDALLALVDKPQHEQIAWLKARGIKYLFYPEAYVTETPAYGPSGLLKLWNSWINNSLNFHLLKEFELRRPRQDGRERVQIFEIDYGDE